MPEPITAPARPIEPPLERRELTFRAESVDVDQGIIRGIAVPYNTPVRIREWFEEYDEQFAPGSIDDEGALAFWRHTDPIGYMREGTEETAGRRVELQISQTSLGVDALTLARDLEAGGRPMQLSIGFEPDGDYTVEERENDVPLVTRTRVRVREVSLVPFGAFGEGATVTEVRERQITQENNMPPITQDRTDDIVVTRDDLDEVERRLTAAIQTRQEPIAIDTRSAAEFLRDLARGDAGTIAAYNRTQENLYNEAHHRAYTGGTSADSPIVDGWVGDLTRLFDSSSGVLSKIFETGTLPAQGMNIEFGELNTNTVQVTEQEAEGDDLDFGKVTLTTRTAPVLTYGGYTQLTRQQIERSTLPILARSLEALSIAAGARKKAALRAAYVALVAARVAIGANAGVIVLGATMANSTDSMWTDAVIDAAIRYDGLALPLELLVTSPSVFKHLKNTNNIELVTIDPETQTAVGGERAFSFSSAAPQVGTLNLPGLTGDLAGLPVVCDPGYAGSDHAAFVNGRALRQYDSALVSLQDENIINLSKDFSVYRYGAVAAEIPAAVVPVKLAAS